MRSKPSIQITKIYDWKVKGSICAWRFHGCSASYKGFHFWMSEAAREEVVQLLEMVEGISGDVKKTILLGNLSDQIPIDVTKWKTCVWKKLTIRFIGKDIFSITEVDKNEIELKIGCDKIILLKDTLKAVSSHNERVIRTDQAERVFVWW